MKLTKAQQTCLEVAAVATVYRLKQNDGKQKGIWDIIETGTVVEPMVIYPKPPLKLIELGLAELTESVHKPYGYASHRGYKTEVLTVTDKGEAYLAGAILE